MQGWLAGVSKDASLLPHANGAKEQPYMLDLAVLTLCNSTAQHM